MHVLIIPSDPFVTSRHPLGGIFQLHQANALKNGGFKVGVISPGVITLRFLFKRYDYASFEFVNDYPVYRRYMRKYTLQRAIRHHWAISFYQELGMDLYQDYVKRFGKPEIIHAHNFDYAGSVAQAIRDTEGVPYIITEHNSNFRTRKLHPMHAEYLRRCAENAVAVTAVSYSLAEAIKKQIGFDQIGVLFNVIDSNFMATPLLKYPNEFEFTFLNVASLDANKNQSLLLDAFAQRFKGQRIILRISGEGPFRRCLERRAKHLGIERQVFFLGHLDRASVMQEMCQANCVVLSSSHETFGVVLIEALAVGTPVISTRCGGPDEIVNEKNGVLVEPGDVFALGNAMEQMVKTKGRYCPTNLREECDIRFGEKTFVSKVKKLYHQAICEKR